MQQLPSRSSHRSSQRPHPLQHTQQQHPPSSFDENGTMDSGAVAVSNGGQQGPPAPRASASSGRSSQARRLTPQQQLSQIEKSVTHLLVATKQLLETLTQWSRGNTDENNVSDVYVRLGYEFNIACRAFNAIGVDTADLGNVPELLRNILEETLSQQASQQALDRYLPRIRDIIINLLHGLKRKQQRLRQRTAAGGEDEIPTRQSSGSRSARQAGSDAAPNGGRASPRLAQSGTRDTMSSESSSMSSSTAQNIPVIAPYPEVDTIPTGIQQPPPNSGADFPHPPPPPPPQQSDALLALQRGGDLERRASRRFSTYQIKQQLGPVANGLMGMPASQNSPIPNRGRDVRESLQAVRARGSYIGRKQPGTQYESPTRKNQVSHQDRISEEREQDPTQSQLEPLPPDIPPENTPRPKKDVPPIEVENRGKVVVGATLTSPISEPIPIELPALEEKLPTPVPARHGSRRQKSPSPPQSQQFVPEESPQPGKELTLFLQYKTKIKKFVLEDGGDLSLPRLQLAFIEKFNWNTLNNGADLPEIYIQDPISGTRYELEDLRDIKNNSVLVLNVDSIDEVKRHFDDSFDSLRRAVDGIKSTVETQNSAIQRVSERQQEAAKEIAGIAAAPPTRVSMLGPSASARTPSPMKRMDPTAQLNEVQSLRRDLAVVRQTYSSMVADIEASMATIRKKAGNVKSVAFEASLPAFEGDSGRAYLNAGKKTIEDESERLVEKVEDIQDAVEDLRKDVVVRGVRPLPRQLEDVAKDIANAVGENKKLREQLKKEQPLWTKIWEKELKTVCEERDMLTFHVSVADDMQMDLEKAAETLALVEEATKQQNQDAQGKASAGSRSASRNIHAAALDQVVDPRKAKDGMLSEVRALQPNHENRLEAIQRAERARQRELESRKDGEFKKELGSFVEEGKLKKTGGAEEAERLRKAKDERIRKEVWERQNARAAEKAEGEPQRSPSKESLGVPKEGAEGTSSPEPEFVEAKEIIPEETAAA